MRVPATMFALLLLSLTCAAQQSQSSDQSQSSSQPQSQNQPEKSPPKRRSTAEDNPFPEDTSKKAAASNSAPDAPASSTPSSESKAPEPAGNSAQGQGSNQAQSQNRNQAQPDKSAPEHRSPADDNPFPEDISKKAAAAAGNSAPDAPASSAPAPSTPSNDPGKAPEPAGNSAPGTSSSRTGLRGLDDVDTPESRISDGAGGYIYNPKLAAQDVKVAGFYLDNGNFEGAYSRFKEATKVDPGNSDAVFGLAEAARGLKRNSEAADNYRIYLDAVPNGSKARAAKKALAALGESAKK